MLGVCCILAVASSTFAGAQEALTVRLLPQGAVSVSDGEVELANLSLNAHGPEWKHVDQAEATGISTEDGASGTHLVRGVLPVPDTEGGGIRFLESLEPASRGLRAEYILGATEILTLNGLHVSLLLPMASFAGQSVIVYPVPGATGTQDAAAAEPTQQLTLPAQGTAPQGRLFAGPVTKVEIAPGTGNAITLTVETPEAGEEGSGEAPVLVVQDLRKWEHDLIEVRLSLVNADDGQWLAAWDKLQVGLSVTFAREVIWQ
jgi:hypothetical protein